MSTGKRNRENFEIEKISQYSKKKIKFQRHVQVKRNSAKKQRMNNTGKLKRFLTKSTKGRIARGKERILAP